MATINKLVDTPVDNTVTPTLKLEPLTDLDVNGDGNVDVQDIKRIYESKTFWINIIAIITFVAQSKFGYILDPSIQIQILGAINILLRTVTHNPIKWK